MPARSGRDDTPWLWLIAGPNGAGKSTRALEFLKRVEEIVNPDNIALRLSPMAPDKVALRAGREALSRTRELIESRRDFAIETTLSGHGYPAIARSAKSENWKVGLIYIGLGNAQLAVDRVHERYASGGHNVPEADIRRRYERSLANIPAFLELADRSLIFDNSSNDGPERLLEIYNRELIFVHRKLPDWLRSTLGTLLSKKSNRRKRRRR